MPSESLRHLVCVSGILIVVSFSFWDFKFSWPPMIAFGIFFVLDSTLDMGWQMGWKRCSSAASSLLSGGNQEHGCGKQGVGCRSEQHKFELSAEHISNEAEIMAAFPRLQPRLQPPLQPRLQPQLQPRLQPQLQPRLQPPAEHISGTMEAVTDEQEIMTMFHQQPIGTRANFRCFELV